MKSSGIPRTVRRACTTAACAIIVRYPHGEKIRDFHIPTTVEDYRAVYRAYLSDPDLQDARARWPFVNMWDNHEFSWLGWQSLQRFGGKNLPAQTRKVAANQAFFEYQPARITKPSGPSLDRFDAPQVVDAPVTRFDEHGLGQEPNNLAAIGSLKGYRALRWGRNVELIVTDQRSYRSEEPTDRPEAQPLSSDDFPEFIPEDAMEILDAGRTYNGGRPPASIRFGSVEIENFCKDLPAQTILGAEQKAWFLDRLRNSKATWKIWGNTTATLDMRADLQNLPQGITKPWPGTGYGTSPLGDHGTAYVERGEIYDFVQANGITGFATVAGDRHSFWAGLAAKSLPPKPFVPVGIAFVTGSISAPGVVEALEHALPKDHPLRSLYIGQGPNDHAAAAYAEPAHSARSAVVSRIRAERRHRQGACALESGVVAACFVRRHGRPRLLGCSRHERIPRDGIRLHSSSYRTQRPSGRRRSQLSRQDFAPAFGKMGKSPKLQMQILEGDPKFSV